VRAAEREAVAIAAQREGAELSRVRRRMMVDLAELNHVADLEHLRQLVEKLVMNAPGEEESDEGVMQSHVESAELKRARARMVLQFKRWGTEHTGSSREEPDPLFAADSGDTQRRNQPSAGPGGRVTQ